MEHFCSILNGNVSKNVGGLMEFIKADFIRTQKFINSISGLKNKTVSLWSIIIATTDAFKNPFFDPSIVIDEELEFSNHIKFSMNLYHRWNPNDHVQNVATNIISGSKNRLASLNDASESDPIRFRPESSDEASNSGTKRMQTNSFASSSSSKRARNDDDEFSVLTRDD